MDPVERLERNFSGLLLLLGLFLLFTVTIPTYKQLAKESKIITECKEKHLEYDSEAKRCVQPVNTADSAVKK